MCGELFVSTKGKSITRVTVMKAYRKVVELEGYSDEVLQIIYWRISRLNYLRIDEKVVPLNLETKYRAETINAIMDNILASYQYEYLWGGLDKSSYNSLNCCSNSSGEYRMTSKDRKFFLFLVTMPLVLLGLA